MSALNDCFPACAAQTAPVSIPGPPGAGTPGNDAFTTVQATFVVPAVGSTVLVSVLSTLWMGVGMTVIVGQGQLVLASPGPGTFAVTAINSSSVATLKFLGYFGDVAVGSSISAGAIVTAGASGATMAPTMAIQTAIAQAITAVSTQVGAVKFTVPAKGNYLYMARVGVDLAGATFASSRTVTIKVRNVTQGIDLATSTRTTGALTTTTLPTLDWVVNPVLDGTANVNDLIEVMIAIDVINSAGTLNVNHCSLAAIPCR